MNVDMVRIRRIRAAIAAEFGHDDLELTRQVMAIAEESGEFIGAARRYLGFARRSGTYEEMTQEMADVFITLLIFADIMEIDVENAIRLKLDIIEMRGYREIK